MDDRQQNRIDINRVIDKILLPYLEEYKKKNYLFYDGEVPIVNLDKERKYKKYTEIIIKGISEMLNVSQIRPDYFPGPTDVACLMNKSDTFCNMKIKNYKDEVWIHFYKSNYTVYSKLSDIKDHMLLFLEESITRSSRCNFVTIGLSVTGINILGEEDTHYNLLMVWKNKITNKYDILIYEPHGYSEPVNFMDNFFDIFKGDRRFNILKRQYISCPIGLQVKSKDRQGFCFVFSTFILYMTLNLLNSPYLTKQNKDYLLNIDKDNINLDYIERYITYDDKYKNHLIGICSVFATKLISYYWRSFINIPNKYQFMVDILESPIYEEDSLTSFNVSFYNLLESIVTVDKENPLSGFRDRANYGHHFFTGMFHENKSFEDPRHTRMNLQDMVERDERFRREAMNPNPEIPNEYEVQRIRDLSPQRNPIHPIHPIQPIQPIQPSLQRERSRDEPLIIPIRRSKKLK